MVTVRVTVNWFDKRPGMGIRAFDRYVTETFDADVPADAVVLVAVTETGPEEEQVVVEVPTLGTACIM